MAKRFLEVDVEKMMFTTVNIVVDDQDPKYKDLFESKIITNLRHLLREVATKASKEIVENYDWNIDEDEVEVFQFKEVSESEARQFVVWDASTDARLEP